MSRLNGSETTTNVIATNAADSAAPVDSSGIGQSYQAEAAIGRIRRSCTIKTVIVTLQNGLGNSDILAAAFGADRVAVGITSVGATLLQPGVVRHAGDGLTVLADNGQLIRPIAPFAALLRDAGFAVDVVADARCAAVGQTGDQCRHQSVDSLITRTQRLSRCQF